MKRRVWLAGFTGAPQLLPLVWCFVPSEEFVFVSFQLPFRWGSWRRVKISPQKNRVSWREPKGTKEETKFASHSCQLCSAIFMFRYVFWHTKESITGLPKKSWWIFRHARPHLKLRQIEAKNVAGTSDILKFIDTGLSDSTNQDFKTLGFSHRNLPLDIQKVFAGDLRHPG